MSQTFAFYSERANEAAEAARAADLEQVRERHLRAEKTWRELAAQAGRVAKGRADAEAAREAARAPVVGTA